jgi:hypothetical protein
MVITTAGVPAGLNPPMSCAENGDVTTKPLVSGELRTKHDGNFISTLFPVPDS